jgi:hypothetical protein
MLFYYTISVAVNLGGFLLPNMDTYLFHTLILLSGFFAAYVGMYVS